MTASMTQEACRDILQSTGNKQKLGRPVGDNHGVDVGSSRAGLGSGQQCPQTRRQCTGRPDAGENRQVLTSALRVDLTRDFATLPLHKGTVQGKPVWFVVTDVSDASIAQRLGLNHAPKLANAPRDCPACVQEVKTSDPLLGRADVEFQGAPDFSLTRTLNPAPKPHTFPPQSFSMGAQAGPNYSPYVRVRGSSVVFNAPIVATGNGPFDVTTHTNTHDRTLGIDTEKMTTDHLFVRGFANGRSIAYLSFDSSDAFTATVERSTFVPALADLQFQNGGDGPNRDDRSDSARASIFTFVNAQTGLENSPPERGASQGEGRSPGAHPRP